MSEVFRLIWRDPQFLKGPSDVVGRPATWHKAIQEDNERAIFSEAQRRFGGLVVAESPDVRYVRPLEFTTSTNPECRSEKGLSGTVRRA
jgi:hypothetical protein